MVAATIKSLVCKTLQKGRAQVDSARMELDAISVPSFERVMKELDTLRDVIHQNQSPGFRQIPRSKFHVVRK